MNCPVCGADLIFEIKPSHPLDVTATDGDSSATAHLTTPESMADWIVTETGLSKLLLEYEKAKQYLEIA